MSRNAGTAGLRRSLRDAGRVGDRGMALGRRWLGPGGSMGKLGGDGEEFCMR